MTNAQKRYYRAQGIDPAQIERDIRQREQEAREAARQNVVNLEAAARAERLCDAPARIERDIDMASIAQTPRRRVLMTGNNGLMSLGILAGKPTGG